MLTLMHPQERWHVNVSEPCLALPCAGGGGHAEPGEPGAVRAAPQRGPHLPDAAGGGRRAGEKSELKPGLACHPGTLVAWAPEVLAEEPALALTLRMRAGGAGHAAAGWPSRRRAQPRGGRRPYRRGPALQGVLGGLIRPLCLVTTSGFRGAQWPMTIAVTLDSPLSSEEDAAALTDAGTCSAGCSANSGSQLHFRNGGHEEACARLTGAAAVRAGGGEGAAAQAAGRARAAADGAPAPRDRSHQRHHRAHQRHAAESAPRHRRCARPSLNADSQLPTLRFASSCLLSHLGVMHSFRLQRPGSAGRMKINHCFLCLHCANSALLSHVCLCT